MQERRKGRDSERVAKKRLLEGEMRGRNRGPLLHDSAKPTE